MGERSSNVAVDLQLGHEESLEATRMREDLLVTVTRHHLGRHLKNTSVSGRALMLRGWWYFQKTDSQSQDCF
jgi:hypothetical protein